MPTLTKYRTFKSMKRNSSVKEKNVVSASKVAEAEISAFLQLLSKEKAKVKKALK